MCLCVCAYPEHSLLAGQVVGPVQLSSSQVHTALWTAVSWSLWIHTHTHTHNVLRLPSNHTHIKSRGNTPTIHTHTHAHTHTHTQSYPAGGGLSLGILEEHQAVSHQNHPGLAPVLPATQNTEAAGCRSSRKHLSIGLAVNISL